MSTGNSRTDTMAFGKHKGSKIGDLLKTDAAYLCWLRDETAKKRQVFFDDDVNKALDGWIKATKKTGGKYRHWATDPPDFMVKITEVEDDPTAEEDTPLGALLAGLSGKTPAPQPAPGTVHYAAEYGDEWGAW